MRAQFDPGGHFLFRRVWLHLSSIYIKAILRSIWFLWIYFKRRHIVIIIFGNIFNKNRSTCEHIQLNMATSTRASPPRRGRPRNIAPTKKISLKEDIYDTWLASKDSLGFTGHSNSEFAAYLLQHAKETGAEGNSVQHQSGSSSSYLGTCASCYYDCYLISPDTYY